MKKMIIISNPNHNLNPNPRPNPDSRPSCIACIFKKVKNWDVKFSRPFRRSEVFHILGLRRPIGGVGL